MSNIKESVKQLAFARWWKSRSNEPFDRNNLIHVALKDAFYSGWMSRERAKNLDDEKL